MPKKKINFDKDLLSDIQKRFDSFRDIVITIKEIAPQYEEIIESSCNLYASNAAVSDQEVLNECKKNSKVEIKDVDLGIDLGHGNLKGRIMIITE